MSSQAQNPSLVTTTLLTVAIVFPILATLAVALRIWTTLSKNKHLFIDDYILILALIFAWGVPIDIYVAAARGGVNYSSKSTLEASSIFLQALWIEIFPLLASLVLVKVSILLLYKRIFVVSLFKIAIWVYIAVLISWGIACLVAQLLAGDPISAAYDPLAVNPLRYDYNIFAIAFSGMSMCFDVIVLCFPLPAIFQLMMSTRRKLQLAGIFWLGIFCCIASVLRFYYVYKEAYASTSSTGVNRYESVTLSVIWATIEPSTSVIAACLPTYGHLFGASSGLSTSVRNFWSRLSLRTTGSSTDGNHSSIGKSDTISNNVNPSYSSNQRASGHHWQWVGIDKRNDISEDIEMGGTSFEDDHVPLASDTQPLSDSESQK